MRRRIVILLGIAVFVVGCQFTEPDQETIEPPLRLRSSYPGDGATGLADSDAFTVIARFRSDFRPEQITLSTFYPAPPSRGATRFDVARELQIDDVVFDPAVPVYRWLLHGPDFLQPEVVTFYPRSDVEALGYMQARVTRNGSQEAVEGAMLFVLGPVPEDDDLPEGTEWRLGRPVETVVRIEDALPNNLPNVAISNVQPNTGYVLLVIQDTNGDGRFDLADDHGGYPRDFTQPDVPLVTRSVDVTQLVNAATAEIELAPPGTLDPLDP